MLIDDFAVWPYSCGGGCVCAGREAVLSAGRGQGSVFGCLAGVSMQRGLHAIACNWDTSI
jgi:hypothetical protein